MPNLGQVLGGLTEGYQQQQERQQRQLYQQFLMQQAQQQAAQQAQALTQQQQALGTAWGAAGKLGGGMGGPPPPQQQPQPGGGLAPGIQRGPGGMLTQNGRPPDTMLPGGVPGWQSQVKQAESGNNYNVGYGGVDLSNAPKDATGFPQWPGGTGPTGQPTHAAGAYQFQPDTWKKYAGGLGVTDFSPQSQDKVAQAAYQDQGLKPWASNPKVMQALQPVIGEAKQTSQQVTQAVPQQQWGRSSVEDLHQAIEQANPDATPQVKMLALLQLQKLMAPSEKAQLQAWMMQNKAELQTAMQETVAQFKQGLKPDQGEKGWQILQTPQGAMRVNPNTGQTAQLDLPAGTTKMGTTSQVGAAPQPDPQKDTMAQGIANYQIAPLSGWALRTPWGKQTMENVLALNPQYAAPDYAARVSGTRAFTSGKQSDTIRSMDVAVSHLDTVDKLGEALANNDTVALNKLGNLLKTQTGAEGPVDFNFAKTIVVDEIVKATAGGVLTGQERQSLAHQLDAANSPEQLSGVISTAKALMAGQLGGLRRQFEGATGKGDEAFDKKLAPETQKALAGKPGGSGGGVPRIENQADYDKLPPGADYIGPDGQPYKKKQ